MAKFDVMSFDELVADMLLFGMPLDRALRAARMLEPLFSDQGEKVAREVIEAAPLLAGRLGLVQLH